MRPFEDTCRACGQPIVAMTDGGWDHVGPNKPRHIAEPVTDDPDEVTVPSFLAAVTAEVYRAQRKHAPMHSAHEGYAVLLEELDELWTEVKRQERDPQAVYTELLHVAAMAVRMAVDCGAQEYRK